MSRSRPRSSRPSPWSRSGPTITDHLGRHVWPGLDPSFGDAVSAPSSLTATDHLDMTQQPRLSDNVVFTVDAPRAAFWRGQTFDEWNGHEWSQSQTQTSTIVRSGDTSTITPDPNDVGAVSGTTMRQTFHIETGYSDVVFAAPSPVSVETDKVLEGHSDGTVTVFGGFGKGATYTVTSRSLPATAAVLRASNSLPVPAAVRYQFAAMPTTTERVQELARRSRSPPTRPTTRSSRSRPG